MDSSPAPTPVAGTSGDTAARIAAFLDAHHVMSLATSGAHGPHAANLFYARDAFALLWVSDPQTRHSMELDADPRVAATVAPDYCDFDVIRGVQIFGEAHRIARASELRLARTLLEARYPSLQRLSDGSAVKQAYESAALYRLIPSRMLIIDNTRGFGHKDVLDFEAFEPRRRHDPDR
jgi:uncharacterized protein YhbP (UPF0306 family)